MVCTGFIFNRRKNICHNSLLTSEWLPQSDGLNGCGRRVLLLIYSSGRSIDSTIHFLGISVVLVAGQMFNQQPMTKELVQSIQNSVAEPPLF